MIIIPALLERGDLFRIGESGTIYRVLRIGGGSVYFYPNNGSNAQRQMGIKSKQKLTLLNDNDFGDPTKLKNYMDILIPEGMYEMLAD